LSQSGNLIVDCLGVHEQLDINVAFAGELPELSVEEFS
jgi:hypothetical protein